MSDQDAVSPTDDRINAHLEDDTDVAFIQIMLVWRMIFSLLILSNFFLNNNRLRARKLMICGP